MYESWLDSDTDWIEEDLKLLRFLTFEEYLDGLSHVMSNGLRAEPFDDYKNQGVRPNVQYILKQNDDYLLGFFANDVRWLMRAACEVAGKPSSVIQDITELVHSGYYEVTDSVCSDCIEGLVKRGLPCFNDQRIRRRGNWKQNNRSIR